MTKGCLQSSVILTGASASGKTTLHCCLTVKNGLVPTPVHTTRKMRTGELPGIDAVFLNEAEYLRMFQIGSYIESTPDEGYFSGAYYGCPRAWITQTEQGSHNCFVCPTVRNARLIKQELGQKIVWIHLLASETVRRIRLKRRNPNMESNHLQQRIASGSRQLDLNLCDAILDTSFLNPCDILRRANFVINAWEGG